MSQAVAVIESKAVVVASRDGVVVPRVIAAAGDQAARRFLEFFAATIRNKNTRMAYYRAAARFFAWCDQHAIGEIADIEPLHVAAYVEAMAKDFEKPTVKQHLAAIRMLFDWLVTGQVVATNPAHSALVALKRGSTPLGPVVRSARGGCMRPTSIVNWFAALFARLELEGCSSHSGRRTFITAAARNAHRTGCSLRDVQLLAGHKSIEITQGYIDGDTGGQRRLVASL